MQVVAFCLGEGGGPVAHRILLPPCICGRLGCHLPCSLDRVTLLLSQQWCAPSRHAPCILLPFHSDGRWSAAFRSPRRGACVESDQLKLAQHMLLACWHEPVQPGCCLLNLHCRPHMAAAPFVRVACAHCGRNGCCIQPSTVFCEKCLFLCGIAAAGGWAVLVGSLACYTGKGGEPADCIRDLLDLVPESVSYILHCDATHLPSLHITPGSVKSALALLAAVSGGMFHQWAVRLAVPVCWQDARK